MTQGQHSHLHEDILAHNARNRDMGADHGHHEGGGAQLDGKQQTEHQNWREKYHNERLPIIPRKREYPESVKIPHVGDGGNDLHGEEEKECPTEHSRVVLVCG